MWELFGNAHYGDSYELYLKLHKDNWTDKKIKQNVIECSHHFEINLLWIKLIFSKLQIEYDEFILGGRGWSGWPSYIYSIWDQC